MMLNMTETDYENWRDDLRCGGQEEYDTQYSAASLYEGGWRARDLPDLIEQFNLTGDEAERIYNELLDLLNVIEDDTPIWIYIDHPFPCKKEGLFFGAVQFAAENDSEWEGYRVVLTFQELYEPLGGVVGMSIVVVKEEP